ncbi:hypothetical protein LOTGIDRAFT_152365 [Lottia gigantea]|uniref:Uncharacterized protein n=1 Tax=Lottia gigantea TaxID=225164 RepID=V4CSJ7_LOTGI|nr:hypothetical protein LOTGIDRAFT_152365 [Lottia gigantea]ESP05510.1 hypothetical protein LOTGIDRAFT_152365 [Lottia gigantea]
MINKKYHKLGVSEEGMTMITVNYRIPAASDVPELGIFRKSPAEIMRDFAKENLQVKEFLYGSQRLLHSADTAKSENIPSASPRLDDDQLTKKLRSQNQYLDLSKYLIPQATGLGFSKYLINRSEVQDDAIQVSVVHSITTEEKRNINGYYILKYLQPSFHLIWLMEKIVLQAISFSFLSRCP